MPYDRSFTRDLFISAGALAVLVVIFAVTSVRADTTISRGAVKVGDNAATDTSYDAIIWLLGDSSSGFRAVIDAANTYFGLEREYFGWQTTPAIAVERSTGKVGLGLSTPKNQLDVEGAAVIGATYSGTNTAPSNGLLVEGSVGIGRTDASTKLHLSVPTNDGIRISSANVGFLQLYGGTSNTNWALANDYSASNLLEILYGTSGATPTTSALTVTSGGNLGLGTGTFGASAAKTFALSSGTAPTTSPTDAVQLWSADRAGTAGKASLHIRTEDGTSHVLGDRVGFGTTTPATALNLSTGSGDGIRISSTNSGFLQLYGGTSNVNWALQNDYNASDILELLVGTGGAAPTTSRLRITSGGNFAFGNFAPLSRVHVPDGAYLQAEDNNAGAPAAADCDDDSERGRLSIDTTSNRLYICNGTTRGWDYVTLTD